MFYFENNRHKNMSENVKAANNNLKRINTEIGSKSQENFDLKNENQTNAFQRLEDEYNLTQKIRKSIVDLDLCISKNEKSIAHLNAIKKALRTEKHKNKLNLIADLLRTLKSRKTPMDSNEFILQLKKLEANKDFMLMSNKSIFGFKLVFSSICNINYFL